MKSFPGSHTPPVTDIEEQFFDFWECEAPACSQCQLFQQLIKDVTSAVHRSRGYGSVKPREVGKGEACAIDSLCEWSWKRPLSCAPQGGDWASCAGRLGHGGLLPV